MISILSYNSSNEELIDIRKQLKDLAAKLTDEKWEINSASKLDEVVKYILDYPIINMACYDVVSSGSINVLKNMRKLYKDIPLLLVADVQMSPLEYVRPEIMASNLILRPYSNLEMHDKLKDMIIRYLAEVDTENDEVFYVETGEGKIRISYSHILYFESRNKKIYVRLVNKELAFYDTLELLKSKLPGIFVRCHRSYLINKLHIGKILLSQSMIIMSHGITVPLSRSYKATFKDLR